MLFSSKSSTEHLAEGKWKLVVYSSVRFKDVWGIHRKMGKPIPSTKPHICIKVRDRYIYISTLEHPI